MSEKRKKKLKRGLCNHVAALFRVLHRRSARKTAAIILSAGSGSRFGGDIPKQFVRIEGVPLLIRSALAFEACPDIHEIVIVARSEDVSATYALCREYGLTKLSAITAGGKTRQESALRGVEAVSKRIGYVAIHDAARCLITPDAISEVVKAAYRYRAATAASPIYDTVKLADKYGFIQKTVDREQLMAAETPQVFERALYRAAAYTAQEKGTAVTDDNSLFEATRQAVKLVKSRCENFKITTPADQLRAESVIRARERQGGEDA